LAIDSNNLKIMPDQMATFLDTLSKRPGDILLSPICRQFFATDRWNKAGRPIQVLETTDQGVMPGAIAHNRRELEEHGFGSATRTARLINPLAALDPVFGQAHELKVLSIGPRTEMELLHLVGVGFRPENIYAVDLISSSPWMDLGDMHKLPYPDKMFDVVISSWVLNYSKDPQLAINEMVRVCAKRGLIAIGLTYAPEFGAGYVAKEPGQADIVGSMQRSVAELAGLFGSRLDRILFQQDPALDSIKGPVMMIARVKPAG